MVKLISYDLNQPGQNYQSLTREIKKLGDCVKPLESLWLVDTPLSADQIYQKLNSFVDNSDRILIIAVSSDYQGYLSREIWDWMNSRIR